MKISAAIPTYTPSFTPASQKEKSEASSAIRTEDSQPVFTSVTVAPKNALSTTSDRASQDMPLEAYGMPSWLKCFGRDLTNELGLGIPGTYVAPENKWFVSASTADTTEYSGLIQKYLHRLYENNGLLDMGARYNALKSVDGLNDRLHQEFKESVRSDPRLMSLMDKLGVEPY